MPHVRHNICLCLSFSYYPAENLIEYKWPPDETGEYYMLQEQVSEYLGVTSFKRKYPGTSGLGCMTGDI